MWPWAHLGFGYLLYSLYCRTRHGTAPAPAATIALAFGTQVPDLVDKPLAWYLAVLPNGRSLAHSVLVAGAFVAVVAALARRYDRPELVSAYAIGHGSHLLADALYPLVTGEWYYLGFLLWPVVAPVEYPTEGSLLAHLQGLSVTPWFALGAALAATAVLAWLRDGRPGAAQLVGWSRRALDRSLR